MNALREIQQASANVRAIERELAIALQRRDDAVQAALTTTKLPIARIAEAAGVSRGRVYQIRDASCATPQSRES